MKRGKGRGTDWFALSSTLCVFAQLSILMPIYIVVLIRGVASFISAIIFMSFFCLASPSPSMTLGSYCYSLPSRLSDLAGPPISAAAAAAASILFLLRSSFNSSLITS